MLRTKILMITGDYAEDYETMVPFQTLPARGYAVHAVCPGKEVGEAVATAIHDFEGDQTYSEKRGHNFALNATFAEKIYAEDYDALVVPGTYPPLDHAGCGEELGVLGPSACRPEQELAGAKFAEIAISDAVTDGKLVTAGAWPALPASAVHGI